MKEIIITPQKNDMGEGYGKYEFDSSLTLKEVLSWLKNNLKQCWGIVTIFSNKFEPIRLFDYDLYNNQIFYYHINGWPLQSEIKEIKFTYCFMNKDITIYLK